MKIATDRSRNVILSVGSNDAEGLSLARIVHESGWSVSTNSGWALIEKATLASAFSVLREQPVPIVFVIVIRDAGPRRDSS